MKAGWLTSEFMLAALTILCASVLVGLDKDIETSWAIAVGAATSAYSLSRGAAKFNPPKDTESTVD